MYFLWPQYLWLMLALPLLPALYAWLLLRRNRAALRYSNVALVRAAASGRQWRRHLPPALLLLALCGLLLAVGRPVARVPLPWARTTIILAMDVSLSMRVGDIQPTRMAAAQDAAKLFLRDLPRHIEVGLVTFAGSSHVARRPPVGRGSGRPASSPASLAGSTAERRTPMRPGNKGSRTCWTCSMVGISSFLAYRCTTSANGRIVPPTSRAPARPRSRDRGGLPR